MNREEYKNVLARHRIPISKLRPEFDANHFSFETTEYLETLPDNIIGQHRAVKAMEFGLSVEQSGYNLFVVGPSGTGRLSYTLDSVGKIAEKLPVPDDQCYVFDFENPNRPFVISLPAGSGVLFQQRMETLVTEIEREIRTSFSSDGYEKKKQEILKAYRESMEQLWAKAEAFTRDQGYILERTATGVKTYPIKNGAPLERQQYEQLSDQEKEELSQKERQIEERLREILYQVKKREELLRKTVDQFMRHTAAEAIENLFVPFRAYYREYPKVTAYLAAFYHDCVRNYALFLDEEEPDIMNALIGSKEQQLNRYKVNLFVNNKSLTGAPVIYETNPTFQNMFGKLNYRGSLGNWVTDLTYIKAGAIHQANGGYLIVQTTEVLLQPLVWNQLKRALQTGCVQIENMYEERGVIPTSGIKPEPVPLRIKIIMIGPYYLYDLLMRIDEDFHKLFKVKVEFDTVMDKTHENALQTARFVKKYAEQEGLLPFHSHAIAKIIDFSTRLTENQAKLSTRFQELSKVLVESSYWANKENAAAIDEKHVTKAIFEKNYRSNHIVDQYREMIRNGTIMVETEGERIGQINGLAVLGTRDASFGIPAKITAQTYAGKGGIINIEREAALSGQIHHKGMMILSGFLSGQFAKERPIPLSASITFEQSYSMIDGDSASSAELYVLLSSLAEVPIHQGIAVTGSVNQWGEIQPIGGVNEKIEGFYQICKDRGLTGMQGVIIPKQNVKNLMLDREIVEAVDNGMFHVWEVGHIAEGLEILTGSSTGYLRDEHGNFPEESIFAKVNNKFKRIFELANQKVNSAE
ncbi:Lon protease family protein [Bacillus sp. FJAT-29814]|uniref:Lon protease family protein n=1 Tax=Bacillus sp. FJAT-29814 TaxID=1729688 RepID=UPI00082ED492|nr:ATP-binding protein [Bacillus sp. FJAT-29814]